MPLDASQPTPTRANFDGDQTYTTSLSSPRHQGAPWSSMTADDCDDRFNDTYHPHDPAQSDSDDDDFRNEKAHLTRPKRSSTIGSQKEAVAYSTHNRSISSGPLINAASLPAWISNRRTWTLGILLGLFVLLISLQSGVKRYAIGKNTINGESPPWYPSPLGGTTKKWEDSYKKASELVERMSLVEKVNITTGTGWMMGMCVGITGPAVDVGFPALCLQDGPLGLRFADNITATPAGLTVGATWNQDLMYKRGRVMGLESRAKGVNVLLGPSVGPIGSIPAGGRNWEGFGIDPVLQGVAAALTVRGIQEEGVMATIKHFVGNEQEHYRQANEWGLPEAISSTIDDRTLHEIYAWPFADTIKHGVSSVMCSYNQVNNSYACQNSKLLNGIIKDEMGFQGFIQSDWLAQRSGVASALAGLDMSMPGDGARWADGKPYWGEYLTLAALNGSIPMERINDMATRVVAAWYQLRQDEWSLPPPNGPFEGPNFSSWTDQKVGRYRPGSDDQTTGVVNKFVDATRTGGFSHSSLSRRIAAEGIVLVKNVEKVLPLSRHGWAQQDEVDFEIDVENTDMAISIYGEDAVIPAGGPNVCPDRGCNKGTLAQGWGSGAVEYPYLVSPWHALKRDFRTKTVDLRLWPKNDIPTGENGTLPEDQDLCIVFVNSAGGEGFIAWNGIKGDRNDLRIQKGGEELVKNVACRCGQGPEAKERSVSSRGNVIVAVHAIGPVLLEEFIDSAEVGAVLLAHLPGQESGNALADVLFGRVNPSGHLPYTIPKFEADYGKSSELIYSDPGPVPQQNFSEGLLVDYRWFDANKLLPRFEFGFGMSYTEFELDNLQIITKYDQRPGPLPEARPEAEREPPSYPKDPPAPETALFPSGMRKLKKYIYPYIHRVRDVIPERNPVYKFQEPQKPSQAGGGEGGNPGIWEELVQVEIDVTNEGERSGQAVIQLYVVFPKDHYEQHEDFQVADPANPRKENEGFDRAKGGAQLKQHDHAQQHAQNQRRRIASERITFPPRVLRAFDKIHLRGSLSESAPGSTQPSRSTGLKSQPEEPASQNQPEGGPPKQDPVPLPEVVEDPALANLPPRIPPPPPPAGDQQAPPGVPLPPDQQPAPPPPDAQQPAAPPPDAQQPPPKKRKAKRDASPDPQFEPQAAQQFQQPLKPGVATQYNRLHAKVAQPSTQYATGEKQTVVFYLTRRDLSYWSVRQQNWVLPQGSFGIEVGFSSRDLKTKGSVF